LDNLLSFQFHINKLQARIKSRIGFLFLKQCLLHLQYAAKHTLVKMTVLPLLDFGTIMFIFPNLFLVFFIQIKLEEFIQNIKLQCFLHQVVLLLSE